MDIDVRLKMMNVEQLEQVAIAPESKHVDRTHDLLSQLFPKHAADALRAGREVKPKSHDCVTVFFAGMCLTTLATIITIHILYTHPLAFFFHIQRYRGIHQHLERPFSNQSLKSS